MQPFFGTAGETEVRLLSIPCCILVYRCDQVTYNTFYSDLLEPYVQTLTSLGVSLNASPVSVGVCSASVSL